MIRRNGTKNDKINQNFYHLLNFDLYPVSPQLYFFFLSRFILMCKHLIIDKKEQKFYFQRPIKQHKTRKKVL